jgi:hypothetical protein
LLTKLCRRKKCTNSHECTTLFGVGQATMLIVIPYTNSKFSSVEKFVLVGRSLFLLLKAT